MPSYSSSLARFLKEEPPRGLQRPTGSTLSDDDSDGDDNDAASGSEEGDGPKFSFPELDVKIRSTIAGYGAVFPKLNFSSPKVPLDQPLSVADLDLCNL